PSLTRLEALARRLSQSQLAHIARQAWARAARERRAIAISFPLTSGRGTDRRSQGPKRCDVASEADRKGHGRSCHSNGCSCRSNEDPCPSRPLQPIRKDLVIRFRRQRLAREAIMAAKEISVKKYVVRLSGEERERLETLLRKGKSPARRVLKARILLKADVSEAGKGWSDNRIIEALETSPSMVYRVRKQLVEEGFEA